MKPSDREKLIDELVESAPMEFLIDEYLEPESLVEMYRDDLSCMKDEQLLAEYRDAIGEPDLEIEDAPRAPDERQIDVFSQPGS